MQAYLVDPKSADMRSKQAIATTQSHEVAHMWLVAYYPAAVHICLKATLQVRQYHDDGVVGQPVPERR